MADELTVTQKSYTEDLWCDEICALVDAGFDTVSRNPSDHEAAAAYRYAIATLLDQSKADAARIAALEEALEPFAEAANNLDDEPDGAELWEHPAAIVLKAGHLRKAAAALVRERPRAAEQRRDLTAGL